MIEEYQRCGWFNHPALNGIADRHCLKMLQQCAIIEHFLYLHASMHANAGHSLTGARPVRRS